MAEDREEEPRNSEEIDNESAVKKKDVKKSQYNAGFQY